MSGVDKPTPLRNTAKEIVDRAAADRAAPGRFDIADIERQAVRAGDLGRAQQIGGQFQRTERRGPVDRHFGDPIGEAEGHIGVLGV